jgi:hypothetical protein
MFNLYKKTFILPKKRREAYKLKKIEKQTKKNKLKTMEDLLDYFNNQKVLLFNKPKDPETMNREIDATPLLRNSLEKKVQTYYFSQMNSIDKIKKTITNLYDQQRDAFKLSLSFGFIFEQEEPKMILNENDD